MEKKIKNKKYNNNFFFFNWWWLVGNALDSEDSEGWLTPPRIASTATPLDASELDALRNRDFRLCLSPLPESLPELLAQLIDEDNVSPVPTHPLKVMISKYRIIFNELIFRNK